MRRWLAAVAAIVLPVASQADSGHPVDLVLHNRSGGEMVCVVQLAHWFTSDSGVVPDGGDVVWSFTVDSADGTVGMAGPGGDRMMVEGVYCGPRGGVFAGRWTLSLDHLRMAGRRLEFDCAIVEVMRCAAPALGP